MKTSCLEELVFTDCDIKSACVIWQSRKWGNNLPNLWRIMTLLLLFFLDKIHITHNEKTPQTESHTPLSYTPVLLQQTSVPLALLPIESRHRDSSMFVLKASPQRSISPKVIQTLLQVCVCVGQGRLRLRLLRSCHRQASASARQAWNKHGALKENIQRVKEKNVKGFFFSYLTVHRTGSDPAHPALGTQWRRCVGSTDMESKSEVCQSYWYWVPDKLIL